MNATLKTILVLSLIALFAGLALGVVYVFTKTDDTLPKVESLNALIDADDYSLITVDGNKQLENGTIKSVCVPVDSNGKAISNSFIFLVDGNGGFSGNVSMLVLVTDEKIANIACYESEETPGLGSNALTDSYLARYVGVSITDDVALKGLAYDYWSKPKKDDGKTEDYTIIEGYTGATRTSTAVVHSVSTVHNYYTQNSADLLAELNKLL